MSCLASPNPHPYELGDEQPELDPPKTVRPKIEGQVELKRKAAWKKRFVVIQDCILFYRTKQIDKKEKMRFDLR